MPERAHARILVGASIRSGACTALRTRGRKRARPTSVAALHRERLQLAGRKPAMRWRRVVAARDQTAGHLLRQVIAPAACLYERGKIKHEFTVAIHHHGRHRREACQLQPSPWSPARRCSRGKMQSRAWSRGKKCRQALWAFFRRFNDGCFFLHLLVALRLRSLRFHSPRLCRVAVFLIQTNVSLFVRAQECHACPAKPGKPEANDV